MLIGTRGQLHRFSGALWVVDLSGPHTIMSVFTTYHNTSYSPAPAQKGGLIGGLVFTTVEQKGAQSYGPIDSENKTMQVAN